MAAAETRAYVDTSTASARVSPSARSARASPRVASWGSRMHRRSPLMVVCSGGGCCGGSGSNSNGSSSSSSSSSSGGCSSHGKDSLANLGKEFEHLVATNTLQEFEKEYISAPMEGKITRDIIENVMETNVSESDTEREKLLDVNEILAEAQSLSNGDLVFSEDPNFVIV